MSEDTRLYDMTALFGNFRRTRLFALLKKFDHYATTGSGILKSAPLYLPSLVGSRLRFAVEVVGSRQ
jgi:hypothetical protein